MTMRDRDGPRTRQSQWLVVRTCLTREMTSNYTHTYHCSTTSALTLLDASAATNAVTNGSTSADCEGCGRCQLRRACAVAVDTCVRVCVCVCVCVLLISLHALVKRTSRVSWCAVARMPASGTSSSSSSTLT
jgi:hypothetical protein